MYVIQTLTKQTSTAFILYCVHTTLQIGNQKTLKIKAQKQILIPAKAVILIGM